MDNPKGASADSRRPREFLKTFYTNSNEENRMPDEFNLNNANFKPDQYLNYLLKKSSLPELMNEEDEMVRNIKSLDSEMQTLVYENYNKFITATETVRQMKSDFGEMEEQMKTLSENMDNICQLSSSVSETLQLRRAGIRKLAGVHTLLQKLQFLFELPKRLKTCIEMKAYGQAVHYFRKSRAVLQQYHHMPTFAGISQECGIIICDLCKILKDCLRDPEASGKQLAEYVDLLLQLDEPAELLCDEYLNSARNTVDDKVNELRNLLDDKSIDILEFVDNGCNGVLCNVSLLIVAYTGMFLNKSKSNSDLENIALSKISNVVLDIVQNFFQLIQERVCLEKDTGDNAILVRALDRFHRRLQAMNKLLPSSELSNLATNIVYKAAIDRIQHYSNSLNEHLTYCITDIRKALAAPKLISSNLKENQSAPLQILVQSCVSSIIDQIKAVLANLQAFIATDISFANRETFREPFCVNGVREGLVVAFFRRFLASLNELGDKPAGTATLLLVLSKLSSVLADQAISYLLILVDEQFLIVQDSGLTSAQILIDETTNISNHLLNNYVHYEGQILSQMVRKSVETRDWLNTIEPRNVRAVMKRVVEDTTSIEVLVSQLFDDTDERKDRGSDSAKRSTTAADRLTRQSTKSNVAWSFSASAALDNNTLLSNINKLFSEKIDIFSQVEKSRASIMTGIIKIVLKTLLECVRLRTFGKYGLQQIQVDVHYLQMYLWRFVQDENLVNRLLDEIVTSSLNRCIDATLMENSVIELICDRG